MSGKQPPPPPGWGQPPPGWGQQPPPGWTPQPPVYGFGPPPPQGSRLKATTVLGIFFGLLIALIVIVAVYVFVSGPTAPAAPCLPGQACSPRSSLPPVSASSPTPAPGATSAPPTPGPVATSSPVPSSAPSSEPSPGLSPSPGAPTPTPDSDSPPALIGTVWRSPTLGYSFEYDPELFQLGQADDDTAVFSGIFFDAQVVVDVTDGSVSVEEMLARQLATLDRLMIARVPDTDDYDALLGPSIGYVRGEGGVYAGTILGTDGTPVAPGGATVIAASDGRLTVAVVVIVGQPDLRLGEHTHQHAVRDAADDFVKTFDWGPE